MIKNNSRNQYLGLDFGTQQLKGVIINEKYEILQQESVNYDTIFPEFRTSGGCIYRSEDKTATTPVLMWVKSLEFLLDKLRISGADFSRLTSMSGSAQQHGTVYWQVGAEEILNNLNPRNFLHSELASAFSVANAPVWMDASTSAQCKQLEEAVGGPQKLAEITGSKAYERYSAAQIMKIAQTKPAVYRNTERISLVSSFAASLFIGRYASIDWSDGSGMNLFDIHSKDWSQICLEACADELRIRLGETVPSHNTLGTVNDYMVERHNFNPDCKVVAFTGDNPSSFAGMRLGDGDIGVSLGTSDTVMLPLAEPAVFSEGHVLVNPTDVNTYMALLCFKNGSVARQRIRDSSAKRSWKEFDSLLYCSTRGNYGNFGLYYNNQEIIPVVQGDFRWDSADRLVSKFSSNEMEVRGVVEGQCVAKRAHAEDFGFMKKPSTRVVATGGGSNSKYILQVLSDTFNANLYTLEDANSAALGAAYRAKHGFMRRTQGWSFDETLKDLPQPTLTCQPYADADQIYTPMVERYQKLIKTIQTKP